ncbi:MAG: FG-GAP-like repeat-containing protein [Deltaproteobacteria bacterium]|nr:FG-GAP-like repeat-containing protein [Deltaproteobacteria bacterium]
MTTDCQTQVVLGNRYRPTGALAVGFWFWRIRGVLGGTPGSMAGPTWQFTVGARDSALDTSWGTQADFDGDGRAELIVGSPNAAPDSRTNAGTVTIYSGASGGIRTTSPTVLSGARSGDNFGRSVASAGDVNGDGFADLLIGANNAVTSAGFNVGNISVYLGGPSGISSVASVLIEGSFAGGNFGWSAVAAGDLNGDGFADIAVGAPTDSTSGRRSAGTVRIFLGSRTGINPMAAVVIHGQSADDQLGSAIAGVGDLNGDGFSDLALGAPTASPRGLSQAGIVQIHHGGPLATNPMPLLVLEGIATNDRFGASIAGGDVNGDGYADLLIGAPNASPMGRSGAGSASLFTGGSSGIVRAMFVTLAGGTAGDRAGDRVAVGDLSGDGFADIAVGTPMASPAGTMHAGSVGIYLGRDIGPSNSATLVLNGVDVGDDFGRSLTCTGDHNGDGMLDLVVGSQGAAFSTPTFAGNANIFSGTRAGTTSVPMTVISGMRAGDNFALAIGN